MPTKDRKEEKEERMKEGKKERNREKEKKKKQEEKKKEKEKKRSRQAQADRHASWVYELHLQNSGRIPVPVFLKIYILVCPHPTYIVNFGKHLYTKTGFKKKV